MKRKLATIQVIDSIEPIEKADRIVKARVMGWSVVVKKGELGVGDRCVFFEVDSVLPEGVEWAAFLRPRGFRVKTCKLRGVLSQGLALPPSILSEDGLFEVGDEVTEQLGVTKYEAPASRSVDALGPFPSAVPKTDEIRLQSALGVLEELQGVPFYISVKCDGSSGTFVRLGGELLVCSRNMTLRPSGNAWWQVAERYELESRLPEGFALQGEVCGPGIQKNRLGLDSADLFVFDVFDVKGGRHLDLEEMLAFCEARALRTVPIEAVVDGDDLERFELTQDHLLELAKGRYEGTSQRREGIVIRPLRVRMSEALEGSRLSFKVLNNEFLLKDEL